MFLMFLLILSDVTNTARKTEQNRKEKNRTKQNKTKALAKGVLSVQNIHLIKFINDD